MKRFIVLLASITLLAGCSALQPKRTVLNNVFHSTHNPEITVIVHPDLQLIGEYDEAQFMKHVNTDGGGSCRNNFFVFGQTMNRRFERGALIQIKAFTDQTSYFVPDVFGGVKNKIDAGIETVKGYRYQYCVSVGSTDELDRDVIKYLEQRGYLGSNAFMFKGLARRIGVRKNTLLILLYAEDISSDYKIRDWTNPDLLLDEQKEFLASFMKRASESIQIVD